MSRVQSLCALVLGLAMVSLSAHAIDWGEEQDVTRRDGTVVVSYRAALVGSTLVIEATHAEGWHTYALDNVERARRKTGKENPETELPTTIAVSGGLTVSGAWFQSEPKDMSDPEIFWHTWGFEGVVYFAVPVKRTEGNEATVTINGQACDAASCSLVDDVTLGVSLSDESDEHFDFEGMTQVRSKTRCDSK